jgi:hypothetical protein
MTTIRAQVIGDKVILPRSELERLLQLARQSERVEIEILEEDLPTAGIMRLAEQGGAFDFWLEEGEDIYSIHDGKPV